MNIIDFHADDYAISLTNSNHIIECIKKGKLNSISIIPNHAAYRECMELLSQEWDSFSEKPLISVHLNFIDGYSISDDTLSLLHDSDNIFTTSWGRLFIASFLPGKKRLLLKQQLESEIKAQIDMVIASLPANSELRIDSHMHTHMIPIVAKALLNVIDKHEYKVSFIRIAQEPILPFLKKVSLYKTYSPINFVKNIILNILSPSFKMELQKRNIPFGLLWGLIMSGHMDKDRIEALYSDILAYSEKKNLPLEILFHPGQALPDEITQVNSKSDVNDFYLSNNRNIEKEAVLSIVQN